MRISDWSSDGCSSDRFAARGRLERGGEIAGAAVVEVKAGDRVAGLGLAGFFFQADHLAAGVELGHAVTLRVAHPVAEHGRALFTCVGTVQQLSAYRRVGQECVSSF